jgi:hypothetical protein
MRALRSLEGFRRIGFGLADFGLVDFGLAGLIQARLRAGL